MMKTLFIGGQEDGKWHSIDPDVDYIKIPEKIVPMLYQDATNYEAKNETFKYFAYRRESLQGRFRYSVFVSIEDINFDYCLIDVLLKGYKGKSS